LPKSAVSCRKVATKRHTQKKKSDHTMALKKLIGNQCVAQQVSLIELTSSSYPFRKQWTGNAFAFDAGKMV